MFVLLHWTLCGLLHVGGPGEAGCGREEYGGRDGPVEQFYPGTCAYDGER